MFPGDRLNTGRSGGKTGMGPVWKNSNEWEKGTKASILTLVCTRERLKLPRRDGWDARPQGWEKFHYK